MPFETVRLAAHATPIAWHVRMRTAILLGAGASRDAGLPLTAELAQLILEDINRELPQDSAELQTLNFVYGAMINHQSETGRIPLAAVDVEKLVSAVRLLAARDELEVAPFVSSWKTGVAAFGAGRNYFGLDSRAHDFAKAVRDVDETPGRADQLLESLLNIVDARIGRGDNRSVYQSLERHLLRVVRDRLLQVGDVSYFAPLTDLARNQFGGLDVVTLNYDLTVEKAAREAGLAVQTGVVGWVPGNPMHFAPISGKINLIKVHGSLNWFSDDGLNDDDLPSWARGVEERRTFAADEVPAIVIGTRDKLGTRGPTLELMHAAQTVLARADRLVVVGYSFSDEHINILVRNWFSGNSNRTMTLLDPGYTRFPHIIDGDTAIQFGQRVDSPRTAHGRFWESMDSYSVDLHTPDDSGPRILVIPKTTAHGLGQAIESSPGHQPVPRFSVKGDWEDRSMIRIRAVNLGSDLVRLIVRTRHVGENPQSGITLQNRNNNAVVIEVVAESQEIEVALPFHPNSPQDRPTLIMVGSDTANDFIERWEYSPPQGFIFLPKTT